MYPLASVSKPQTRPLLLIISTAPRPHPDPLTCTLTHWIIWQQNGRWDLNPDSLAPEFMLFLIKIYYLLNEFSSFSLSQSKETFPA